MATGEKMEVVFGQSFFNIRSFTNIKLIGGWTVKDVNESFHKIKRDCRF